jgi:hypothetical protein
MMTGVNIEATVWLAQVIGAGDRRGSTAWRTCASSCEVEPEGITGCIAGRAIYEGSPIRPGDQGRAGEASGRAVAKRIIPA